MGLTYQQELECISKLLFGIPLELRPMTELDEANYEADNHIYHGSYSSFEEYKKAMRK